MCLPILLHFQATTATVITKRKQINTHRMSTFPLSYSSTTITLDLRRPLVFSLVTLPCAPPPSTFYPPSLQPFTSAPENNHVARQFVQYTQIFRPPFRPGHQIKFSFIPFCHPSVRRAVTHRQDAAPPTPIETGGKCKSSHFSPTEESVVRRLPSTLIGGDAQPCLL